MKVVFTLVAERQIDSLHAYITANAGEARADGYIARIINFCMNLTTFPLIGRLRDDLLPGLRIITFERRVTIAFFVTEEAVLIEGIFYGGQDFAAIISG